MYVYIYIYIYVHTYIHTCYVCICVYARTHSYTYVHIDEARELPRGLTVGRYPQVAIIISIIIGECCDY